MYYIYKIENIVNHRKYIGLTNNYKRRKARHFGDLKRGVHDNAFLQKEYNIYGKDNFIFDIEFQGEVSEYEIGEKEKYYIRFYDSYKNGYNQNEGGNFGASNGGSQLTETDIYCILSALEFMSRPGQILANIYDVSRTTISRIKNGVNHSQYKDLYDKMSLEERKYYYTLLCDNTNFYESKINTTIIKSKRRLNELQIHLILINEERKILPWSVLKEEFSISSNNTFYTILKGKSYKDYVYTYNKLTDDEKNKLASLLSNKQKKIH